MSPCGNSAGSADAAGGDDGRDGRAVVDCGVGGDSHPLGNDVCLGGGAGGGNISKSWSGKRSRFVKELGHAPEPGAPSEPGSQGWTPAGEKLRAWRLERARADGVPPYVVFHDRVLHEIAATQPMSLGELSQIPGVGPAKLERYGEAVLALVER